MRWNKARSNSRMSDNIKISSWNWGNIGQPSDGIKRLGLYQPVSTQLCICYEKREERRLFHKRKMVSLILVDDKLYFPFVGNKIYRQIKLTHHFSLVKKPPFDLLSSRSKCKAVWILVDISQTFLYHLKITQCFLIFNLISWYYQTCVSLTSPCFSALLAELHRTFPEKREGILKYSVCTWDINVRTVPSANNQEAER